MSGTPEGKRGKQMLANVIKSGIALLPFIAQPIAWAGSELHDALRNGANAASEGDWQNAVAHFRQASSLDPKNAEAAYGLGLSYYHIGQFDNALAAENKAVALDPSFKSAYIELAAIYTKLSNTVKAKECLLKALAIDPDNLFAKASLEALQEMPEMTKPPEAAVTAPVIKPPSKEQIDAANEAAIRRKADSLYRNGDCAGLIKHSEDAFERGDNRRAAYALQLAVRLDPNNTEAHTKLATVLVSAGSPESAINEARRAAELRPNDPQAHLLYAYALSRANMWNAALDEYKAAYDLDRNSHEALIGQAVALAKQGSGTLAKLALETNTKSDPASQTWGRIGMSLVLEEQGQLDEAYEQLSAVVKAEPANLKAKHTLAELTFQMACRENKKARFKESAQLYSELLKYAPYDVEAYVGLGLCLDNIGDRKAALKALNQAVLSSPYSANAHGAYARILAKDGQKSEALEHAKLALKLDPSLKAAKSIVDKLSN
jgi:tetratricopeptide (TPR) repeat protein